MLLGTFSQKNIEATPEYSSKTQAYHGQRLGFTQERESMVERCWGPGRGCLVWSCRRRGPCWAWEPVVQSCKMELPAWSLYLHQNSQRAWAIIATDMQGKIRGRNYCPLNSLSEWRCSVTRGVSALQTGCVLSPQSPEGYLFTYLTRMDYPISALWTEKRF